jgi:DNA-binding NtrC family response regulator
MIGKNCLIIEDNPSNFEILRRLVDSFELTAINIGEPEKALIYLEHKPTRLVIIDTDYLKDASPRDLTSKVKRLNPDCVVAWLYIHEPGAISNEEEKPDILLKKPIGMGLFQEALVPYLLRHSAGGNKRSLN